MRRWWRSRRGRLRSAVPARFSWLGQPAGRGVAAARSRRGRHDFTGVHGTLRVTPAPQAGIADPIGTIEEIVNLGPEPKRKSAARARGGPPIQTGALPRRGVSGAAFSPGLPSMSS